MDLTTVAGLTAAALMTVAPPAFAQAQTQTTDIATTQTFTGCLMTEPAYRKAHHLGSGALGGVGLGDELVLVDATVSPANGASIDAKATAKALDKEQHADKKAGTDVASGKTCADQGMAFRLTGAAEDPLSKMKNLLGAEVVIEGHYKDAKDVSMGGTPAAGKLPAEVVIESFQPAPAAAPAALPPAPAATIPPPPSTPPSATPPTVATTPAPQPKELPHTAGSDGLFGLIGALTIFTGALVGAFRRRAA